MGVVNLMPLDVERDVTVSIDSFPINKERGNLRLRRILTQPQRRRRRRRQRVQTTVRDWIYTVFTLKTVMPLITMKKEIAHIDPICVIARRTITERASRTAELLKRSHGLVFLRPKVVREPIPSSREVSRKVAGKTAEVQLRTGNRNTDDKTRFLEKTYVLSIHF